MNTRDLLKLAKTNPALIERILRAADTSAVPLIMNAQAAFNVFYPIFEGREHEALALIVLNRSGHLLKVKLLTSGNDSHTVVCTRQIFREALTCSRSAAQHIILAHNHPSGDLTPSAADIEVTHKVAAAGRIVGVTLDDHLIIAGDRYLSLRTAGHIASRS